MSKSRRKAREAAMFALYEMEIGHASAEDALEKAREETSIAEDQAIYMTTLVEGVKREKTGIDRALGALIREYDFDRVAAIDRNLLRIGAYELMFEPSVPPAVSINEAIEIAKKYSTAESGKFVNGVLGRLLRDTPKANWNPEEAPKEEVEQISPMSEPEPEVTVVEEGSPEAEEAARFGVWKLRRDDA